jgi:hypothetical protein
MKYRNRLIRYNTFFVIAMLISLVGIFAWRLATYYYADDLNYMHVALNTEENDFWRCLGRPVETLSDVIESSINHYNLVNSRLANIVCIATMTLPRWATNLLDATMAFAMLILLLKAAGVRLRHTGISLTIWAIALFWLAFPWYDNMQSSCFVDNYVWTSTFVLAVIVLFKQPDKLNKCQIAATCLLALAAAWMHEAFGCALIAYSFMTWLLGHKRYRKARFIIGVAMCIGLIIGLAGATTQRIDAYAESANFFEVARYLITQYVSQSWPTILAIIVTIITRKRLGKYRFKALRVQTIACFVAIAVSYIIAFKVVFTRRAIWNADLFAVVQTLLCLYAITRRKPHTSRAVAIACSCAALLYGLWFCELVKWQNKFANETRDLLAEASKVKDSLMYYDITPNHEVPFYLLGIVNGGWNCEIFRNVILGEYTCHQTGIIILPTAYRGIPLDSLNLGKDTQLKGVWPVVYSENKDIQAQAMFTTPMPAVTPIDRALMTLLPDTVYAPVSISSDGFSLERNNKRYYLYIMQGGRTLKHRKFIGIVDQ